MLLLYPRKKKKKQGKKKRRSSSPRLPYTDRRLRPGIESSRSVARSIGLVRRNEFGPPNGIKFAPYTAIFDSGSARVMIDPHWQSQIFGACHSSLAVIGFLVSVLAFPPPRFARPFSKTRPNYPARNPSATAIHGYPPQ